MRNPADSLIRIFSIGYVDGSGATQPLNPTVTPNRFPSIELTAPAGNSVVSVGVPVTITASATELDTGDSIASVTFFAGNTKIGEVTAAPYTITWEPTGVATYSLTARAADTRGAVGVSAPILLTVEDTPRSLTQTELFCSVIYLSTQTVTQVTLGGQSLTQTSVADHGTGYKVAVYTAAAPVNVADLVFSDTSKTGLPTSVVVSGTQFDFQSAFTASASSVYTGENGKYETFISINTLSPAPDADFWYFNHITAKYLKWLQALDGEIDVTPAATVDLDTVNMLAGYDDGSALLATGTWTIKSGSGTLAGNIFTAPATGGSTVLTMTYSENGVSESGDLLINTIVIPALTDRSPAIDATNVLTDSKITVTFNQDMDTTTISTSTFQLKKGSEIIAGAVSYSDARTFVFTPTSSLQSSGTRYTVSLSTAIKSGTGAALASEISWNFTTTGTAVAATSELLVTEVGSNFYSNYGAWFEVYNNTDTNLDLSQYTFKTTAKQPTGTNSFTWTTLSFTTSMIMAPRSYGLIVSQATDNMYVPANVALIPANNGVLPWWYGDGFIEISKSGATIDCVRFGSDASTPLSGDAWSGSNAPALPYYSSETNESSVIGRSIQRALNLADSNSGSDWTLRSFATPGGMNDVTDDTDADGDGIPDTCEQSGKTFIGLNVYDWGARAGQKDIFMHINYMNSSHLGLTPNEQALDKVAAVFLGRGYHLHFDVGSLFSSGRHNLDGNNSHQIPLSEYITLGVEAGSTNLYELKAQYLPLARRQFFYYCVFGNKQSNESSTGLGECPGNDFLLSLGIVNFTNTYYTETQRNNYLINEQASTLMHEFGHNLGLKHGGGEDQNYKPNYISTMNYLYSWGLPDIANDMAGDRYYHMKWSREGYSSASIWKQYFPNASLSMHNNAWSTDFVINYSDGTMGTLDENSLSESFGLGNGSRAVDWNGDGSTTSSGLALNITPEYDIDRTQISDYNDWSNINIFFTRSNFGAQGSLRASSTGTPSGSTIVLLDDRQPVPPCNRPPISCSHDH